MCGRYTLTAGAGEIGRQLRIFVRDTLGSGTGRFNVAPTQQVLAIAAPDGAPTAELMRWGLVPPWATDLNGSAKMINARLESVTERPAFRSLIPQASRRALQIADGYYEWLRPESKRHGSQPFHFQVDGGAIFAFAALWTPAQVGGERIHSTTLLTCDSAPNPIAAGIHDRMPVILADPEARAAWLDPSVGLDEALALCGPLAAERLTAQPANPALNKAGALDGPELLTPPAAPPLAMAAQPTLFDL